MGWLSGLRVSDGEHILRCFGVEVLGAIVVDDGEERAGSDIEAFCAEWPGV